MKKQSAVSFVLILSLFVATLAGQTPSPARVQQQTDDDDVVRITTNLVQLDAVVTDKAGKQVVDLRPEEFEILEDDRPQTITNFSYVSTEPGSARQTASSAPTSSSSKTSATVLPARVRAGDARRTVLLVVDDLGLTNESAITTRRALKKFVEEQLRPTDVAAVVSTSGGSGAAQQLTSDKKILLAAVERVHWNPLARSGLDTFSYGTGSNSDFSKSGPNLPVASSSPPGIPTPGAGIGPGAPLADSIKALSFILGGLKGLPGRKSVVLFSDSFTIFPGLKGNELEQYEMMLRTPGGGGASTESKDSGLSAKAIEKQMEEMELRNIALSDNRQSVSNTQSQLAKLLDLANQVSAVIYTVDPRGLVLYNLGAETTGKQALGTGSSPGSMDNLMSNRSLKVRQTQVGLDYVARQTGGFLIRSTSDINDGLQRILDDTAGYYLIGYRPAEGTFEKGTNGRGRFHKIRVNVTRPGLTVRSRKGFFGTEGDAKGAIAGAVAAAGSGSRNEQLMAAINSPFQTSGVPVRLTTLFGNELSSGSFVRTLLHVDANGLTFKPDAEGWQTALMEVLAMTFDESGGVLEQVARQETIQVKGATHARLLRNGLVYAFDVPVKKAGSYQLRVAVRDAASERVGSAQQLIEVPDLSSANLALSGILARGVDPVVEAAKTSAGLNTATGLLSGPPKISETEATQSDDQLIQPGPDVRRLRRGLALEYRYTIFNAQRAGATNRPQLQTQTLLFRDGQQIWAGEPRAVEEIEPNDAGPVATGGRLMLGTEMTPGAYVLQVVVTDALAKGEKRTATQWIDFEVVK